MVWQIICGGFVQNFTIMSKNVTNLRKAGNLNEAFRVAQAALDARPDDV